MQIEGIIIHKTPYKDRDLICRLLLRSGKTVSVYFYGGRGGGKTHRGSILDFGHMVQVELASNKKKLETNLMMAKEYKLLWSAQRTREDFRGFYLCIFFLELIGKIAVEDDLEGFKDHGHEGLFNVLSNSLFFLDQAVKDDVFDLHTQLFIFLAKLSIQLGVSLDIENCLFCGINLSEVMLMFDPQNGGFVCYNCCSKRDEFLSDNKVLREEYQSSTRLRNLFEQAYHLPYKDFQKISKVSQGLTEAQFNYINLQFGFTRDQFKSWGMISVS